MQGPRINPGLMGGGSSGGGGTGVGAGKRLMWRWLIIVVCIGFFLSTLLVHRTLTSQRMTRESVPGGAEYDHACPPCGNDAAGGSARCDCEALQQRLAVAENTVRAAQAAADLAGQADLAGPGNAQDAAAAAEQPAGALGGATTAKERNMKRLLERIAKSSDFMIPEFKKHIDSMTNKDFQVHDSGYILEHALRHSKAAQSVLDDPIVLDGPIPIVSACNSNYEARAVNMAASVQFWSPKSRIIIYDLGMTSSGRSKLNNMCNVEVRDFDFSKYPAHVKSLMTYSWKPPIIAHVVSELGWALWLDASCEVRSPLWEVEDHILFDGHFAITTHPDPTFRTVDGLYKGMGTSKEEITAKWKNEERYMQIGGNVQGYRRHTQAYKDIVETVVKCALVAGCIAPPGSSTGNHRFDQSAFTVAMVLHGYFPIADHRFNGHQASDPYLSKDETQESVNTITTRRGGGGPYAKHAKTC